MGHSENLPILYRNVLDALPDGIAHDAFLWAVERPGEGQMCYRAESFAREVHMLVAFLRPLHAAGFAIHAYGGHAVTDEMQEDLMRYVLQRHANRFFSGNAHPPYAARVEA